MKYIIGMIFGIVISISSMATAGWLASGIGGAAGAAIATSGIEGKIATINGRIDTLVYALDHVKVCK
jgi:hypothetical protein